MREFLVKLADLEHGGKRCLDEEDVGSRRIEGQRCQAETSVIRKSYLGASDAMVPGARRNAIREVHHALPHHATTALLSRTEHHRGSSDAHGDLVRPSVDHGRLGRLDGEHRREGDVHLVGLTSMRDEVREAAVDVTGVHDEVRGNAGWRREMSNPVRDEERLDRNERDCCGCRIPSQDQKRACAAI